MMLDGRAMHYRAVSDGAVIADGQRGVGIDVQRAIILYIGTLPDHDRGHVAAHHGIVPDAGPFVNSDIANHNSAWRDKYVVGNSGPDAVKGEYRHKFLLICKRTR